MSKESALKAYRDILTSMYDIDEILATLNPRSIENIAQLLNKQLGNLKEINDNLDLSSRDDQEINSIANEIFLKNKALTDKIASIRALIKNELGQITTGKKFATGYKSNKIQKTGSIINSAN